MDLDKFPGPIFKVVCEIALNRKSLELLSQTDAGVILDDDLKA